MKIVVDAMGGDKGVTATVKGSIDAIKDYGVNITLIGEENIIINELKKYDYDRNKLEIINANDIITNEDKPVNAIRRKKDSSMVVGLKMLKEGKGDAFISSGNTGALLTGGLLITGRIKGIERPALAPVIPNENGFSVLIDAGANVDCKPKHLLQFSIMGSIYAEKVLQMKNPKIGLVNIGTEESKGNELVKNTYKLLKESDLNFYGNVEGRDIPKGFVDVIVCDGFVGNTILKLTEGLAFSIFDLLKSEFMRNTFTKLAALILKPGLKAFKKKLDYKEIGGAPFLGVKKPIIKAHGSSDATAIKNAIKQAKIFVENNIIEKIENEISKLEME